MNSVFFAYQILLLKSDDFLKEILLDMAADDSDISAVEFVQLKAIAYPNQVKFQEL